MLSNFFKLACGTGTEQAKQRRWNEKP